MSKATPSGSPRNRGYGPNGYCVHCGEKVSVRPDGTWVHTQTGRQDCPR